MSYTDPKKIKRFGDKADSKPEWEERKYDTMKYILTAKFSQNEQLREKLIDTGTTPLLECTTNLYWGTGWRFENEGWNKGAKYPGKNNLGHLLSEIRELLTVKGNQQELFGLQNRQIEVISDYQYTVQNRYDTIGEVPVTNHTKDINIGKGGADIKSTTNNNKSTHCKGGVEEASKELDDDGKLAQATGGEDAATTSSSEIMELEEAEGSCLSFNSDLNRSSFNSRSIIKADGHLDHEKMMGWVLPTIDTSNLRRLASTSFPELARRYGGVEDKKTTSILAHSTPVIHVTSRKTKKAKKKLESSSVAEEKRNLILMLNKFKNSDISKK